jgi:hypothetical protein
MVLKENRDKYLKRTRMQPNENEKETMNGSRHNITQCPSTKKRLTILAQEEKNNSSERATMS